MDNLEKLKSLSPKDSGKLIKKIINKKLKGENK